MDKGLIPGGRLVEPLYVLGHSQEARSPAGTGAECDWLRLLRQDPDSNPAVPGRPQGKDIPDVEIRSEGCIFCDVSRDKGYHGSVGRDKLMAQIKGLPEVDGRKIPFELIDEYPIRSLGKLMEDTERHEIRLSQINLVCRVDDINDHASDLAEVLSLARRQDVKIMFASIGFESFCDRLLHFLCKCITVADIVKCVETLRRLKDEFGNHLSLPSRRRSESRFYPADALG